LLSYVINVSDKSRLSSHPASGPTEGHGGMGRNSGIYEHNQRVPISYHSCPGHLVPMQYAVAVDAAYPCNADGHSQIECNSPRWGHAGCQRLSYPRRQRAHTTTIPIQGRASRRQCRRENLAVYWREAAEEMGETQQGPTKYTGFLRQHSVTDMPRADPQHETHVSNDQLYPMVRAE
jgi:hypothetical protein